MQLTWEQKATGRRNFLKAAAVLPAVGAFAATSTNAGPVKVGVVGTGVEGRILMSVMNKKYTYINAICDIRPDNRSEGEWYVSNPQGFNHNPNVEVYKDYDEMLANADIEAVICATPLKFHGPMGVKALEAGKHFFTEKTMAMNMQECKDMIRLAEQKGLNLQVGHQRFYNPLYWDAYRMYKEGLLGNVYHIRSLWHRNMDWNYWYHIQPKYMWDMEDFDPTPWGYRDVQHLVNWRWYNDTSLGLWTELFTHQSAITNWFFGDVPPTRVFGSGTKSKIAKDIEDYYAIQTDPKRKERKVYEVDDREYDDHIYSVYEYENNEGTTSTVTYSSIQSNSFDNYYEQIMGTYATIIITKENETYLFWEPGWDEEKAAQAAEGSLTAVSSSSEDYAGSAFAAHVSGQATGGGGATGMAPTDPYRWELEGFAHTIRTGAPNLCDGYRGMYAAQAAFAGVESAAKDEWVTLEKPVV